MKKMSFFAAALALLVSIDSFATDVVFTCAPAMNVSDGTVMMGLGSQEVILGLDEAGTPHDARLVGTDAANTELTADGPSAWVFRTNDHLLTIVAHQPSAGLADAMIDKVAIISGGGKILQMCSRMN